MSKRLHIDLPNESELRDEMWQRVPPVMDAIALRSGYIAELMNVGNQCGFDEEEIGNLFGVKDMENPTLTWEYRIESAKDKQDLVNMLTKIMSVVLDDIDFEEKRSTVDTEEPEEFLEKSEYELYMVYRRARKIRNLVQFALEHDLDLEIG